MTCFPLHLPVFTLSLMIASLLTNDFSTIEKCSNDNLVRFNQGKMTQVISRKHRQDFPPVFMSGHELDISSSFTHLGPSVSSNLTWKPHIHSIAKHASQEIGFLSRAGGFFSPSQLLTMLKSQICPSLEYCSHVRGCAPKSSVRLLNKVQSKAIQTSPLQSLSLIVVWLQIFPSSIDIFMDIAHWNQEYYSWSTEDCSIHQKLYSITLSKS